MRVFLRVVLLAATATLPYGHAFSQSAVRLLTRPSFRAECATGRACSHVMQGLGAQGEKDASKSWRRDVEEKRDAKALAKTVFETDDRPIILYDGICNLCNGGVNFMLDWDSPNEKRGNFRFAALQSEVGKALLQRSGRRPDDVSSIILATKDGNTYSKSDAILRIGQGLGKGTALNPAAPILATAASLVVPPFLRDGVYDMVANNRYNLLGKSDECRLWDDRFEERFVGEQ